MQAQPSDRRKTEEQMDSSGAGRVDDAALEQARRLSHLQNGGLSSP
jgi:hypothetical protein